MAVARRHSLVKTCALYQCTAGRRQTSLTASTIFAATKLALRSWFHVLYAGCTVVSDGLSCFRGDAAAGCGHQPIRTGSGRKAVLAPAFKWVNTALGNIKTAIVGTYPALRDKHVPRYLGVRVPLRPRRTPPMRGKTRGEPIPAVVPAQAPRLPSRQGVR